MTSKSSSTWIFDLKSNIAFLSYSTGLTIPRLTAPWVLRTKIGLFLLIPTQILIMVIITIPILFLDLALGQYSNKTVIKIWDLCPVFRGIGICSFVLFLIYQTYYSFLCACTLCFAFLSLTHSQEWKSCGKRWNKVNCFTLHDNFTRRDECAEKFSQEKCNKMLWQSSVEQFYLYRVLNTDDTMSHTGAPQEELLVCALLTTLVIFVVNYGGQKFIERILITLLILPTVQLLILFFNPLMNSYGSLTLYHLFTHYDKSYMSNLNFWTSLTEFSLSSPGLGFGVYLTFATQSSFRKPIHLKVVLISLINNLATIVHSVAIHNFLINLCFQNKILVEDFLKFEQELKVPEAAFFLDNSSKFWIITWLTNSYLLGLRSLIVMMFVNTEILYNGLPRFRKYHSFCLLFFCILIYNGEIVLSTKIGYYIVKSTEKIIHKFSILLLNIFSLIGIVYCYGIRKFRDDVNFMLGIKFSTFWNLLYIVNPIVLTSVFVFNLWNYYKTEPERKTWIFIYENILLWFPPVIIVSYALIFILLALIENNLKICRAGSDWGPRDKSLRYSRLKFKIYNIAQEYLYHKERFTTSLEESSV